MIKVEIVGGPKKPNKLHQIAGILTMLVAIVIFVIFTIQFLVFFSPIIIALILFSVGIYYYNKS